MAKASAQKITSSSTAEYFAKNLQQVGFSSHTKAVLTTIKEAVDNSLDACEDSDILPEISVLVEKIGPGSSRGADSIRVTVEDNGPGIVKAQIPKIFAKLLYGSKFHRLKQSRGQQGIGISAAGLYGQLTTGKPFVIVSKTGKKKPAHRITLRT